MARPRITLLDPAEIERIQGTSLRILADVGVHVPHAEALERLATRRRARSTGRARSPACRSGSCSMRSPRRASSTCCTAVLPSGSPATGTAKCNLMSTPGQFAWFEARTGQRRDPTLADARAAITLGDALPNVTVVGAMAVPLDVPAPVRDVVATAELVRGTGKPTRTWPVSRASTEFVLEIYEAVAGGAAALRERPMVETFLEPISPLRFPETGLDVMIPFIERGQPVSVGPMVMASGTGPATLAGTLAQENAEILAGITIVQAFAPGHPMMYGGIPHVMDPRTATCSFGSPEQGLMALAMAQIGQAYGFPVYVNANLDRRQAARRPGRPREGGLARPGDHRGRGPVRPRRHRRRRPRRRARLAGGRRRGARLREADRAGVRGRRRHPRVRRDRRRRLVGRLPGGAPHRHALPSRAVPAERPMDA